MLVGAVDAGRALRACVVGRGGMRHGRGAGLGTCD